MSGSQPSPLARAQYARTGTNWYRMWPDASDFLSRGTSQPPNLASKAANPTPKPERLWYLARLANVMLWYPFAASKPAHSRFPQDAAETGPAQSRLMANASQNL